MTQISCVIPTRGDVDMREVLYSLPFTDTIVWDNSIEDHAVYARYLAIADTKHPLVYTQDDDAVLEPQAFADLVGAWQPGAVVCNMPPKFHPHYSDSALVGFGALFERDLPGKAFEKFSEYGFAESDRWPSGFFARCCDVVFTVLTPRILVDVPYRDREFASAPNRMWRQPTHFSERQEMLRLARIVRDAG